MTVLLQKEIIKLLANGPMTDGEIRNRLNSQMWDVSHEDVLDALRWLQGQLVVECPRKGPRF